MTRFRRAGLIACSLCLQAQAAPPVQMEFAGPGMGTKFRVLVQAESGDRERVQAAVDLAFRRLQEWNAVFSDYEPNSEINRLAAAAPEPQMASADLLDLMERSLELAAATEGAFDPACGQLTRLWRSSRQRGKLAPVERLERARQLAGWRHVSIHPGGEVAISQKGVLLDLGGIAKGYAADGMLRILQEAGFARAVVQAGGDTAAGDAPVGETGWRVTIETGLGEGAPMVLTLANRSVSTSGDLHQFVELDGQRYSHIIDPRSGLGLTRRIACTVLAEDSTTADALATALCVQGPERGMATAKAQGVEAHWRWLDESTGTARTASHVPPE